MATTTERPASVRVSQAASVRLENLVKATGKTKVALLDEALEALEDRLFWAAMDAGYAEHGDALRAEIKGTEGSLLDVLESTPV